MNIINGFIAFLASILAIIGFMCFVVGSTTISAGPGRDYYSGNAAATFWGFVLMGGSIFLFSLVVKRWRKGAARQQRDLQASIKAELREELRQEMGLSSPTAQDKPEEGPASNKPDARDGL